MDYRKKKKTIIYKTYINYMILGILLVVTLILGISVYEFDSKKDNLEKELTTKNHFFGTRLSNDIVTVTEWVDLYSRSPALKGITTGENLDDKAIQTEIFENLVKITPSVEMVSLVNLKGEPIIYISRYRSERKKSLLNEDEIKIVETMDDYDFYYGRIGGRKVDQTFKMVTPVYEENDPKAEGYLVLYYSIRDFYDAFTESFDGSLGVFQLGILNAQDDGNYTYYSLDSKGERQKITLNYEFLKGNQKEGDAFYIEGGEAPHSSYNLGGVVYERIRHRFDKLIFDPITLPNEKLVSFLLRDSVEKIKEGIVRRYLILGGATLIIMSILLWLYVNERINRSSYSKSLTRKNSTLNRMLNTKKMIMSVVAHDLKSPFTTLLGNFQLLERRYDKLDKAQLKPLIDQLNQSAVKLYTVTENLLEWATLDNRSVAYVPENINIYEAVKRVFDIAKEKSRIKKIVLINEIPEGTESYSDINLVETILRNLIVNAIKFSPRKESVIIRVYEKKKYLELQVIDNGIGIGKKTKDNLSKGIIKSTRGTENEKGTGLGLYIVREFAKINGGRLKIVDKAKGEKGSILSVELPKKK